MDDETTIMKVEVPEEYRTRLHGIKVLTDSTLSETVTEALEAYFQALREDRVEARAGRGPAAEGKGSPGPPREGAERETSPGTRGRTRPTGRPADGSGRTTMTLVAKLAHHFRRKDLREALVEASRDQGDRRDGSTLRDR